MQSDCKTATSSWAIQGNFWQACQPTEALILLLIESYVIETSVPSFLHVEKFREASPVISVRIQHVVVTKLLVSYWFSLYCLMRLEKKNQIAVLFMAISTPFSFILLFTFLLPSGFSFIFSLQCFPDRDFTPFSVLTALVKWSEMKFDLIAKYHYLNLEITS